MTDKKTPSFAELIGAVQKIHKPPQSPDFGRVAKTLQPLRLQAQHKREIPQYFEQEIDENYDLTARAYQKMLRPDLYFAREIDCHGKYVDDALRYIQDALNFRKNKWLCYWLIIHGKGRNSLIGDRAPVKFAVIGHLRCHPAISAIRALRDGRGESGAVVVAVKAQTF
ncbi:Smr/MutS family protein [Dichelobacter nodosus]|uniref:Smr/MutS family protein n=1 Tax=Dichelobacter nodosus TaxID=870 RepID=UPI00068267E3|nr:Smr/MutS family protein [Dichelobacter nodosus]KNZ39807.1 hypothetical protein AKG33_01270 [Dichelobacter nodosus]